MHALPPRLLIAFMCLSLADCSTARAMASGLRPEAAKTGRGRTVMLEGDLAELIDRRWQARLFEKDGNVRVAALVFHREGEPVGDFRKAWATPARLPGSPTSCSTTSVAPRPGTWCARVSPSASPWQ